MCTYSKLALFTGSKLTVRKATLPVSINPARLIECIITFNDSFQLETGCVCKPDSAPSLHVERKRNLTILVSIKFVLVRRFQM